VSPATLGFAEVEPLVAAPGTGPRHIVFLRAGGKTFMYLVGELDNTITVYQVTYHGKSYDATLAFEKVSVTNTFGDRAVPQSTAAEIHLSVGDPKHRSRYLHIHPSSCNSASPIPPPPLGVSSEESHSSARGTKSCRGNVASELTRFAHPQPDNRFLLVSSRSDRSFDIPSFEDAAKTIPSDSISSFTVDPATGSLSLAQTFPAGGLIPRQFSINKAGDRLAVGLQADGRVVVIERDVQTGLMKRFVGSAVVGLGVTAVLFDE
jgi:6-phosphogluconolactonase (cycloisomerase 2 family)